MVFTTTNLFKGIACPYGEQCSLTNCIFSHDLRTQLNSPEQTSTSEAAKARDSDGREPAAKRRKVTYDSLQHKPPSKADQIRSELAAARTTSTTSKPSVATNTSAAAPTQPKSLTRAVSPPPPALNGKHNNKADNKDTSKTDVTTTETLNPRLIANGPAGHGKRTLYLKYLHAEMVRLNQQIKDTPNLPHKRALTLTDEEVIRMSLDEEERLAKEHRQLYENKVKQRLVEFKKMKPEAWAQIVQEQFKQDLLSQKNGYSLQEPTKSNKDAKPINTDLPLDQEHLILPHLLADQSTLAPYGYVPTPPSTDQIAEAAAAVAASRNYEICDRCSARFQVFPDRNEEGLLASNGPCKHHPNRKIFPPKTKGDVASGSVQEAYFPCCNGALGTPGCTETEYHVFKASTPARLACVMPFVTTPENTSPTRDDKGNEIHAVAFDCEMGYTVYGLELIRLTAIAWPSGEELLDALVRPLGTIIDLNSRFSGVWPEHFASAVPYAEWLKTAHSTSPPALSTSTAILPVVSSPHEARALLCTYLTPATPLLGHAIENDLNAVRLCHPSIIDTILLYPHPRGLPMRFGLKMLTSRYLGRAIQTGGERGHDSKEDAVATAELVRVKVGEKWRSMKLKGWRVVDGKLTQPDGSDDHPGGKGKVSDTMMRMISGGVGGGAAAGRKRRRKAQASSNESSAAEEEDVPQGSLGVAAYLRR